MPSYEKPEARAMPDAQTASRMTSRKSGKVRFFKATENLIFREDLHPSEKLLIMAIGLHDWGDGRGGHPCNSTLVKACGFKNDGPDKGQGSLRAILRGLKGRGLIRIETVKTTKQNPTGRLIFINESLTDEQSLPGDTAPVRNYPPGDIAPAPPGIQPRPPRGYSPGPSPGIQPREIEPSFSSDSELDSVQDQTKSDLDSSERKRRLADCVTKPTVTAPRGDHAESRRRQIEALRSRSNNTNIGDASRSSPVQPGVVPRVDNGSEESAAGSDGNQNVDEFLELLEAEEVEAATLKHPVAQGLENLKATINSGPSRINLLASLDLQEKTRFMSEPPDAQAAMIKQFAQSPGKLKGIKRRLELRPVSTSAAFHEMSTEALIECLPDGDPPAAHAMADRFARDFGAEMDRKLFGEFVKIAQLVQCGGFEVEKLLDSYRQGMGPKAKNRGAVFFKAMKNHGLAVSNKAM